MQKTKISREINVARKRSPPDAQDSAIATVVAVTSPTSVAAAASAADECLKATLVHTKSRTKLQKQMSA